MYAFLDRLYMAQERMYARSRWMRTSRECVYALQKWMYEERK